MADIRLIPDKWGNGDTAFLPGDIETDAGLTTAVYISLFTDRRDTETSEGGWWGDSTDDRALGSLLWTLRREKMSAGLPDRVKGYCEQALQWLIDERIAQSVAVSVERYDRQTLSIGIDITKADAQTINIKYSYNWAAQFAS